MSVIVAIPERRTSADVVFESLYEQIMSLHLLPGARMSELDIAEQFGVSRQPVREAFSRLGNMGLLVIQPQRPTRVQKFSDTNIRASRFLRMAVELEAVNVACDLWSEDFRDLFEQNLAAQDKVASEGDQSAFHELDAQFHELITQVAQAPFAYDMMMEKKLQIDRICVLSLKDKQEMDDLVADHHKLFASISSGDKAGAEAVLRIHLTRIEKTINSVRVSHKDYFVD